MTTYIQEFILHGASMFIEARWATHQDAAASSAASSASSSSTSSDSSSATSSDSSSATSSDSSSDSSSATSSTASSASSSTSGETKLVPRYSTLPFINNGAEDNFANLKSIADVCGVGKITLMRPTPHGFVYTSATDTNEEMRNTLFSRTNDGGEPDFFKFMNEDLSVEEGTQRGDWEKCGDDEGRDYIPYLKAIKPGFTVVTSGDTGDNLIEPGGIFLNERMEVEISKTKAGDANEEFGGYGLESGEFVKNFQADDDFLIDPYKTHLKEMDHGVIKRRISELMVTTITRNPGHANYVFIFPNCSPSITHDGCKLAPLLLRENKQRERDGITKNVQYWRDVFDATVQTYRLYQVGKKNFDVRVAAAAAAAAVSGNEGKSSNDEFPDDIKQVPAIMAEEERSETYTNIDMFLQHYPEWISSEENKENKEQLREDMKFYLRVISTPWTTKTQDVEYGCSPLTRKQCKRMEKRSMSGSDDSSKGSEEEDSEEEELRRLTPCLTLFEFEGGQQGPIGTGMLEYRETLSRRLYEQLDRNWCQKSKAGNNEALTEYTKIYEAINSEWEPYLVENKNLEETSSSGKKHHWKDIKKTKEKIKMHADLLLDDDDELGGGSKRKKRKTKRNNRKNKKKTRKNRKKGTKRRKKKNRKTKRKKNRKKGTRQRRTRKK